MTARCLLGAALLAAAAGGRAAAPAPLDLRLPLAVEWRTETGYPTLGAWRAVLTGELLVLPEGRSLLAVEPTAGAERWRRELPTAARMAALVDGGRLLLVGALVGRSAGGDALPDLHLIDPASGAARGALAVGGVFAAPAVAGRRAYVASTHALAALDLDTGALAWRVDYPRDADGLPGGPAQAGAVFVETAGGSGPAPAAAGVVVAGAADGRLHAYDAASGAARWSRLLPARLLATPVVYGGTLIAAAADTLFCVQAADGVLRWRLPLRGRPAFAAPVLEDGMLYLPTGSGGSVAAVTAGSGDLLWETALDAPLFGRPALTETALWVGDVAGRLTALSRGSGRLLWQQPLADAYLSEPVIAGGRLVVGTGGGSLLVLAPLGAPAPPAAGARLAIAPNPARGAVQIDTGTGEDGRLLVHDVLGRRVLVLATPGGVARWEGTDAAGHRLPSGTYFLRLERAAAVRTGKLQIIR